jgi:hypothetical protein
MWLEELFPEEPPRSFFICNKPHQSISPINLTNQFHQSISPINLTNQSHQSISPINLTNQSHKSISQINLTNQSHQSISPINLTNQSHQSISPINLTVFVCNKPHSAGVPTGVAVVRRSLAVKMPERMQVYNVFFAFRRVYKIINRRKSFSSHHWIRSSFYKR